MISEIGCMKYTPTPEEKRYLQAVSEELEAIRKEKCISLGRMGAECDKEKSNLCRDLKLKPNLQLITLRRKCTSLGISVTEFFARVDTRLLAMEGS